MRVDVDVDVDVDIDRSEMSLVGCRRDVKKGRRRPTTFF